MIGIRIHIQFISYYALWYAWEISRVLYKTIFFSRDGKYISPLPFSPQFPGLSRCVQVAPCIVLHRHNTNSTCHFLPVLTLPSISVQLVTFYIHIHYLPLDREKSRDHTLSWNPDYYEQTVKIKISWGHLTPPPSLPSSSSINNVIWRNHE